jgi:hypothetical protein
VPRLRRSICSRDAKPGPRAGAGGSDGGEEGIERRRLGWWRALPWNGTATRRPGEDAHEALGEAVVVMEFSTRHDNEREDATGEWDSAQCLTKGIDVLSRPPTKRKTRREARRKASILFN